MLMAALMTAAVAFAPADDKKTDKDDPEVRKLDQAILKDVKIMQAKPGVVVYSSEEDVAKAFDKDAAAAVARAVDFKKEEVAFVNYQVGGPPFGQLKFNADAKEKSVEFYVEEPKGGGIRGNAIRLGRDLYAIPKGTKATFGGRK